MLDENDIGISPLRLEVKPYFNGGLVILLNSSIICFTVVPMPVPTLYILIQGIILFL